MYPTIYDAVKDIFGISITHLKLLQSFGFFVAISFLLCAWVFAKELNRKERQGHFKAAFRKVVKGLAATKSELTAQFIFGFVVGFKVIGSFTDYKTFSIDPRAWTLSTQGSLISGVAVGLALAFYRYKQSEKQRLKDPIEVEEKSWAGDHVGNMTLVAAFFGFLGAKIFHILENFGSFLDDPMDMLFSFSGLTMYGGLILGGAAVLVYAKKQGFNIFHVMDACAPGLFLAYGVGRLGCQVSGDGDWGIVNLKPKPGWLSWLPDWFWAYDYPNNVNNATNPYPDPESAEHASAQMRTFVEQIADPNRIHLIDPVYPTPLYEAIVNILFFAILWSQRKKFVSPGALFSVYLIFNGLERFLIELIRVNTTLFEIGSYHVTQAEIIALCLFTLGVIGLIWTKKRAKTILV
ncbi:MAG: prolipoprotein diacylglyceryl transferase [Bacteroidota bacterium]|nr:prolipoprotein diacylglyceryl transferase [Bacteroidota bacterium]